MKDKPVIPPHSSKASQIRTKVAYELVQLCPPELGKECILTGSSSRGYADEASDLEQVFYVDTLPTMNQRENWLEEVGVSDLISDYEPIADGSIWATFRFQGIWIEAGWQTIAAHEQNLQDILAGQVIDHHHLKLAEIIEHAFPLRSVGLLAKWQEQLTRYPDILPSRIIADAAELWLFPPIVEARFALIRRNEILGLHERLVRDVHNVLRILFAINRQWEPDWKWVRAATGELSIKPDRLAERINAIFTTPEPLQHVIICLELVYDTLKLVPASVYDSSRALATISESLRLHRSAIQDEQ